MSEDVRPGEPGAYDRGVKAGQIDRQLSQHGERLDKINGSMADVAKQMAGVHLALQQITNQMTAEGVTRTATALALKEAAEAQRQATEKRWSPVQKWIAFVSAAVLVAGFVVTTLVTLGTP